MMETVPGLVLDDDYDIATATPVDVSRDLYLFVKKLLLASLEL